MNHFEAHLQQPRGLVLSEKVLARTAVVDEHLGRLVRNLPTQQQHAAEEITPASESLPEILQRMHVKARLVAPFLTLIQNHTLDIKQLKLFTHVNAYRDVSMDITAGNDAYCFTRNLIALHCVNHVFKTRDLILKNSAKIRESLTANEKNDSLDANQV